MSDEAKIYAYVFEDDGEYRISHNCFKIHTFSDITELEKTAEAALEKFSGQYIIINITSLVDNDTISRDKLFGSGIDNYPK